MRKRIRFMFLAIVAAMVLSASPFSSAFADQDKLDYVALGDSLAAGQYYDKTFGDGYADFLANQLEEVGELGSFSKIFAKSGYTTKNVLDDLQNNVEREDGSGNMISIQDAIAEAEIVTLDAGANDLLRVVVDPETGLPDPEPDEELVQATLTEIGTNIGAAVAIIKGLNPDAAIYIMGYYNPYPHLPAENQEQLNDLLGYLNGTMKQVSETVGATFVQTDSVFNKDAKDYLPNPQDIHPNKAGYLVLANAFWNKMVLRSDVAYTDELPDWAEEEINYLSARKIIQGFAGGHFGAREKIQRDHSALMLKRATIYDPAPAPHPNYSDVTEETFAYETIAKLTAVGIFEGTDGKFNPTKSLKRGEMAKILAVAYGLEGEAAEEDQLADVNGHWAATYIHALAANGIITGFEDGTFRPEEEITRAQFAVLMARAANENFKK